MCVGGVYWGCVVSATGCVCVWGGVYWGCVVSATGCVCVWGGGVYWGCVVSATGCVEGILGLCSVYKVCGG